MSINYQKIKKCWVFLYFSPMNLESEFPYLHLYFTFVTLQISAKRMALPYFIIYININSNWIADFNMKWKTNKFLEDKTGEYLYDLRLGK